MKPWEKYQAQGQPGPWDKYAPPPEGQPAFSPGPPTLQERAREVLPFEELAVRGTVLPMGRTQEGEVVPAVPQFMKDIAVSSLLPGHVAGHLVPGSEMQPGTYSSEDVARFTMDISAPMTAGRGIGAARSAIPSEKGYIAQAPTDEMLRQQARTALSRATRTGAVVEPDSFKGLLDGPLRNVAQTEKLNPTLHPRSSAAYDILRNYEGQSLDVEDLMIARRILGQAMRGVTPEGKDDRRIARSMMEKLDNYVDNLAPVDLASGTAEGVGKSLEQFRNLWARMSRSNIIEDIIDKAETQASGFENGIRIGFRSLVRDKKRLRGFSPEEVGLMRKIASGGGSGQTLLRLLGKMSFGTRGGSNWLGGTASGGLGATAGGLAGGWPGAVAGMMIPGAVGYVAQKAADRGAMRAAELSRAITAVGGGLPRSRFVDNMIRTLMETGGPVLAATPEEKRPLSAAELRNMF